MKPSSDSEVEKYVKKVFDEIFNKEIDKEKSEKFSEKLENIADEILLLTDGSLLVALLLRKLCEIILL